MKILLLCHAFNGLTQRLHRALREAGHAVTVELDIADAVTEEAVALADPDLIVAPFLKRRIPESVWSVRPCLVVHPGPPGDRCPAALDWAVLRGDTHGGVTVLQATGEFDGAGVGVADIRAARRCEIKAALYRQEVTRAAVEAVLEAVARGRPCAAPRPRHTAGRARCRRSGEPSTGCTTTAPRCCARSAAPTATPAWPTRCSAMPAARIDARAASAETLARAPRASPARSSRSAARRCCAARATAACG